MKTLLAEIKFALENGFTKVTRTTEKDGSVVFIGTFGYVAMSNAEDIKAIEDLISEFVKEDTKEETIETAYGLVLGDVVSTGKRTKVVKEFDIRPNGEVWIVLESKNGGISVVGEEAARKYKVLS